MSGGKPLGWFMETIESLKAEVTRLRGLLESSQREVYDSIREKAEQFQDPILAAVVKLRSENTALRAHEAELLTALQETKQELGRLQANYELLLDESEAELVLKSNNGEGRRRKQ